MKSAAFAALLAAFTFMQTAVMAALPDEQVRQGLSEPSLIADAGKNLRFSQHTGDKLHVMTELGSNETAGASPWMSVPISTRKAFGQSFVVVGIAELFDKTWFVAVLCSLSCGARLAFAGSFTALALHSIIAALLGMFISRFFELSLLHFMTASVFFVLAALYGWEWQQADPSEDAIEGRSEEAREAIPLSKDDKCEVATVWRRNLFRCFVAVFIAEWGDRTQIAMISLHASLPVIPVCLGSMMAFFVLSMSAVAVASLLQGRTISERTVLGVSAISFFVFAALALLDGMHARASEQAKLAAQALQAAPLKA